MPEALEEEDHPSPDGLDFLGRLTQNKDWWDSVAKDSFVREAVRGHKLEFESVPPVRKIMKNIKNKKILNFPKRKILQEEVESLLEKGAVEPVRDHHKGFYSNLFVVPKKDGGWRPVINLSGIRKKPFRMATLKDVSQSLRQGDWASTIDLKDAYLHVPIAKEHRRFLRFSWGGTQYQFRRLPFGLSSAPLTFTRVTLPLVTLCRTQGIRIIVYLDDFLVLGRSKGELRSHTAFVLNVLKKEPQEVQPGTKAGVPVSGSGLEHKESQSLSARRQEERFQGVGSPDIEESQHSLSAEVPGQSYLCMEGSSLGEAAYQTVPDVCNQGSEVRTPDFGRRSREGYQMVDSNSGGRSGVENASNNIVHDNRCLNLRLGRDTGPQVSQWEVDSEGSGTAHQSSGAVSGDEGGSSFCSEFEKVLQFIWTMSQLPTC